MLDIQGYGHLIGTDQLIMVGVDNLPDFIELILRENYVQPSKKA